MGKEVLKLPLLYFPLITLALPGVQALLPVMREMGEPRGHPQQARLELRLALIAAAPWRRLAQSQAQGQVRSPGPACQAVAIFSYIMIHYNSL